MSQQPSAFIESLIRFLLPFFIGTTVDMPAARAEILETLNSYGARTRAETLNAARIIAFSMASLDTLMEAKAADLSPSMKIRYRSCANGLNRSTIQNEKILDRSLGCELPTQPDPIPEPVNDVPNADVQDAIEYAQAMLADHRARTSGAQSNLQDRNKQLWAGAMIDTLKEMGFGRSAPNGPTITG
jgi:hypothetical protein